METSNIGWSGPDIKEEQQSIIINDSPQKQERLLHSDLSQEDANVVESLIPIFPHLSVEVIKHSVLHPSNRGLPFNADTLLHRCIDDLLDKRTYNELSLAKNTVHVTEKQDKKSSLQQNIEAKKHGISRKERKRHKSKEFKNSVISDSRQNHYPLGSSSGSHTFGSIDSSSTSHQRKRKLDKVNHSTLGSHKYTEQSDFYIPKRSHLERKEKIPEAEIDPPNATGVEGFGHNSSVGAGPLAGNYPDGNANFNKDLNGPLAKRPKLKRSNDFEVTHGERIIPETNSNLERGQQDYFSLDPAAIDFIEKVNPGSSFQIAPKDTSGSSGNLMKPGDVGQPGVYRDELMETEEESDYSQDESTYSQDEIDYSKDALGHTREEFGYPPMDYSNAHTFHSHQQDVHNPLQVFPNHSQAFLNQPQAFPNQPQGFDSHSQAVYLLATPVLPQAVPGHCHTMPSTSQAIPTENETNRNIIIQEIIEQVLIVYPDADRDYVARMALGHDANTICNLLLENSQYAKVKKPPPVTATVTSNQTDLDKKDDLNKKEIKTDFFNTYDAYVDASTREQSIKLLKSCFRQLKVHHLKEVAAHFNNHFAPSYKLISDALKKTGIKFEEISKKSNDSPGMGKESELVSRKMEMSIPKDLTEIELVLPGGKKIVAMFMKKGRGLVKDIGKLHPDLKEEVEFVIKSKEIEREQDDQMLAATINENEYEETGQLIECGCCYQECPFETLVQCLEGHLFCTSCLKNYTKEAVFGGGKATLECMTDGCGEIFPISQLEKALPKNVLSQYEDRVQEEVLNLAEMEDLVRCPYCSCAAILDPGDKVFSCPKCHKETCRYCQEDWSEHFGIPCSELEKKDETKLRLQYEEKMTQAKIRTCAKCKASFTKSDGCNKMTCRCGAKMCYICRKPNIDYNHFCQHPKEPGKACAKCQSCSLWTNPDEDDDRAVKEIQKMAHEKRIEEGYTEERLIGAPENVR